MMIPELSTCSRIFCQCQKHIIHVDLVWQLWMGGGGRLMGHLASGCGFNSVFVTWIEVLGMMSTSFFFFVSVLNF
jgi:hypothetical protein